MNVKIRNRSIRVILLIAVIMPFFNAFSVSAAKKKGNNSIYLIKNGSANGHIFRPQFSGRATQFAAQELQEHLRKMTGVTMPYAWFTDKRNNLPGIILKIRSPKEWKGKESSQAFTISQDKRKPRIIIEGNTNLAVLYGVYQYLHNLGIRWFTPGDIGTNIPKKDIVLIPGKKSYTPSFRARSIWLDFSAGKYHFGPGPIGKKRMKEFGLWQIRNWTPGSNGFEFGKVYGGGHNLMLRALADTSFEKEPERYSYLMRDGKFKRVKRPQICFSNEKNVQCAIKDCVRILKEREIDPERVKDLDSDVNNIVGMALSDAASGLCQCAKCKKIAGSEPNSTDRLVWDFMNKVARGVDKAMPGKKISVYAPYPPLSRPPADVKIEPNIITFGCRRFPQIDTAEDHARYPFVKDFINDVRATIKAGAEFAPRDYGFWDHTPQSSSVLDAIKAYYKMGVRYYTIEVMQVNEQNWPVWWAMNQLTWNVDQDPQELLKQFFNEYFGEITGKVAYELQQEIDKNTKKVRYMGYGSLGNTSDIMTDKFIREFRGRLNKVWRKVRNTPGKERLRFSRYIDSMEMQFQMAESYRAYCKALNLRSDDAIKAFRKKAQKYDDWWRLKNLTYVCTPDAVRRGGVRRYYRKMALVDFKNLKPKAMKKLAGPELKNISKLDLNYLSSENIKKSKAKTQWFKELFASSRYDGPIKNIPPNLFALPEVCKFWIDYNNAGLKNGWEKPDFDDSKWNDLSSWNYIESQGLLYVDGYYWYRNKFKTPKFPGGKKIFLRIGSIDDSGEVYLNGIKVGEQPSAHDWAKSLEFDVTKIIKPGEDNVLVIRGYDCMAGAGVWRPSAIYTN